MGHRLVGITLALFLAVLVCQGFEHDDGDDGFIGRHLLEEDKRKRCTDTFQVYQCGEAKVCKPSGRCGYCTESEHCPADHFCVSRGEGHHNICDHKDVFPLSWRDVVAICLIFVCSALAAGGGVGGGGLFMPLLMILLGFTSKHAAPISNTMIFAGGIGVFFITVRQRHPFANRPLIDYDISLCLIPMTLAGCVLGVLLNVWLPEWFVVLLLLAVLIYTTIRTARKGVEKWKEESVESKQKQSRGDHRLVSEVLVDDDEDEDHGISVHSERRMSQAISVAQLEKELQNSPSATLGSDTEIQMQVLNTDKATSNASDGGSPVKTKSKVVNGYASLDEDAVADEEVGGDTLSLQVKGYTLEKIHEVESRTLPMKKFMSICGIWVVVFLDNLVKGGGHGRRSENIFGIKTCSFEYWAAHVFLLVFLALSTLVAVSRLNYMYKVKSELGYEFLAGDIRWNIRNSIRYPLISFGAGLLAGCLGLGGGMIIGPLLLEMGIPPPISAATSSFMILFTASATSVQFMLLGLLPYDYGFCFSLVSIVSSMVGQKVINYFVKKYHKGAIIIFSLTGVIGISTVIFLFSGSVRIYYMIASGDVEGVTDMCD